MSIRVVLVDMDDSRAGLLRRSLIEFELDIVAERRTVSHIDEVVQRFRPDALVLGIDMPDDDTLYTLAELNKTHPCPVVMFAEKDTPQCIQKVVKAGISAFVVDDIQPRRLPSIINIAIARFKAQQLVNEELEAARSKLAERKVLEKAKGLLMSKKGYSEDEAYKNIRKMAMDKGLTMGAVASNVIDVLSLLEEGI